MNVGSIRATFKAIISARDQVKDRTANAVFCMMIDVVLIG